MVPTVARMLLTTLPGQAGRCATLRQAIVTGEAFPVEVRKRLVELLPQLRLHSFFGMTEVGQVTVLEHETQFSHPPSVGRVLPGVEVRLVGDDDGYLYIVDRKKDMVLSGGFNIYTKEVEQVLAEHADVADAAVIGVPDPFFCEAVAAFIKRRAGRHVDAQSIQEFSRARIASYKEAQARVLP